MTLREAISRKVWKIRRSIWEHPDDHVELVAINDGIGPWATLVSPVQQRIAHQLKAAGRYADALSSENLYRTPFLIIEADFDIDEWEPYEQ